MTCTVSPAFGTVKSRIPVSATSGAERSSQGRALPCFVLVRSMDIAHNDVRDCVYNFGDKREHNKKRTAPDGGQLQNIGIVDIQIGCKHGVEQKRAAGTEQIPEPFFFACDILRMDPAVKQLCR